MSTWASHGSMNFPQGNNELNSVSTGSFFLTLLPVAYFAGWSFAELSKPNRDWQTGSEEIQAEKQLLSFSLPKFNIPNPTQIGASVGALRLKMGSLEQSIIRLQIELNSPDFWKNQMDKFASKSAAYLSQIKVIQSGLDVIKQAAIIAGQYAQLETEFKGLYNQVKELRDSLTFITDCKNGNHFPASECSFMTQQ